MQIDAKQYVIGLVVLFATACDEAPPSKWDRANQGIGEPVSPTITERLEEHDDEHGIAELEPEFRGQLRQLLQGLRRQGWAARIAKGRRSVKDQLRLFDERKSRVIRGAHLCGRAADLSLYPIGMPSPEHAFWNSKDELALKLGLQIVPYTKGAQEFVDRPHVESRRCTEEDWDALGLSEVGTFRGGDVELVIRRADGELRGTLKRGGESRPLESVKSTRSQTAHAITFDGGSGTFTVRDNKRVARPDYQGLSLTVDGAEHALRRRQ